MDENGKAGKDYEGKVATTISGKECQKWSEHTPHKSNYPDVGDHNYCRNPGDDFDEGVWCYTTDKNKKWELCDVPKCDDGQYMCPHKKPFILFGQSSVRANGSW